MKRRGKSQKTHKQAQNKNKKKEVKEQKKKSSMTVNKLNEFWITFESFSPLTT